MKSITSIQIQVQTRDMLKRAGNKGESYDRIVRRLLEHDQEE